MNRKAILLGASPGENSIPGVFSDLSAFYSFLRSNLDGSWEPEEIICQENPGLDSILKSVTEAKGAEYSLVYFGGTRVIFQAYDRLHP